MDGGNVRGIDSETGEPEHYDNEPSKKIKGGDMETVLGRYAGHIDAAGGNYAYIWDGDSWHTIENKGIESMIQQLNQKFLKEKFGVDLSEGWERKWENFLMENVDQDKLVTNIKVLLQDEIPEHVDAYVESVLNDFRRGDISQYTEMNDDDIVEDFTEYIATRMSP